MKILILSDIHANAAALAALPQDYDYLLCAGDLVDYGPDPGPCIKFIRERAKLVVRGNHDQAVGYRVDCGCGYEYKELSLASRQWMWQALTGAELDYLRWLPLDGQVELGGCRFYLTHAVPGDMYHYLEADADDDRLRRLTDNIAADVIIWGHTHKPWMRQLGDKLIVNPGSVGQPRDGNPLASYALWEDGQIRLMRRKYPLAQTVRDIKRTPLSHSDQQRLIAILRNGGKS